MKDEERLIHALNDLADIAKHKEAKREKEMKVQKEKEEKRNRLYKLYYEQAPPISWTFPKSSSLTEESDKKET